MLIYYERKITNLLREKNIVSSLKSTIKITIKTALSLRFHACKRAHRRHGKERRKANWVQSHKPARQPPTRFDPSINSRLHPLPSPRQSLLSCHLDGTSPSMQSPFLALLLSLTNNAISWTPRVPCHHALIPLLDPRDPFLWAHIFYSNKARGWWLISTC